MGRRQIPKLYRRAASREPKPRFTIFCEGLRTEPAYFEALVRMRPAVLRDIKRAAGVPFILAQSAVAYHAAAKGAARRRGGTDSYEERDQTWAVFDHDQHPRYEEAVDPCRRQNIGVARSNPCFELWLILHESDYDRPNDSHAVQRHLRTLRPEYDPHGTKTVDCADLVTRIEAAERRSAAQLTRRERDGNPFGNPSTTVGNLIRAILDAAKGDAP